MKNKINSFLCLGILCVASVEAQQNLPVKTSPDSLAATQNVVSKEPFIKAELYGFIKNDIFYDTRQNIGAGENIVPRYLRDRLLYVNGKDKNVKQF